MLNSGPAVLICLDEPLPERLLIGHVRPREAHQRLHLPVSRRDRALYLVETVREHGRAKQRIIKNLGRKEAVTASGALERLASSVARYAERAVVLSQLETGNPERLACKRIGAPLLFGRLWEETGCRAVIEDLLSGRGFEFAVERAVFATVLHRIMVSGSDRACEKWLADYDIPGVD